MTSDLTTHLPLTTVGKPHPSSSLLFKVGFQGADIFSGTLKQSFGRTLLLWLPMDDFGLVMVGPLLMTTLWNGAMDKELHALSSTLWYV